MSQSKKHILPGLLILLALALFFSSCSLSSQGSSGSSDPQGGKPPDTGPGTRPPTLPSPVPSPVANNILPAHGIPFAVRNNPSAFRMGRYFNPFANGIQDNEEVAVDCGGFRNDPCNIPALDIQVVISSVDPVAENPAFEKVSGQLNGIQFYLVRPVSGPTNHQTVLVNIDATRDRSHHAVTQRVRLDYDPVANGLKNFAIAKIQDADTGRTLDASVTRNLFFAEALGRPPFSYPNVVFTGGSQGAGDAFLAVLANEHSPYPIPSIRGSLASGTPASWADFQAWHEFYSLREAVGDAIFFRGFMDWSPMYNLLKYFPVGSAMDEISLGKNPFRRHFFYLVNGSTDNVVSTTHEVNDLARHFQNQGATWLKLDNIRDAGHGDPKIVAMLEEVYSNLENLLDQFGSLPNTADFGAVVPWLGPPAFENILRGQRNAPPEIDPALLTAAWTQGLGSGNASHRALASAALPGEAGKNVWFGNINGRLIRLRWDAAGSRIEVVWNISVGQGVMDILPFDLSGSGRLDLVVATQNGLYIVEAQTGQILRRLPGKIRAVTVGRMNPQTSEPQIAYIDETPRGEFLTVIGANSQVKFVDRAVFASHTQMHFRAPYLYTSSSLGFVFAFSFAPDSTGKIIPVAEMNSPYLAQSAMDLKLADTSLGSVAVVTGGVFAEAPKIYVLDLATLDVRKEVTHGISVENLQHLGSDQFIVSNQVFSQRIDIGSEAVSFIGSNWGPVIFTDFRGNGGSDVLQFNPDGDIVLRDETQAILGRLEGLSQTQALTGYENPISGRRELSVLRANGQIQTLDADDGSLLAVVNDLRYIPPLPDQIARIGADPNFAASFQTLHHGGEVFTFPDGRSGVFQPRCGHFFISDLYPGDAVDLVAVQLLNGLFGQAEVACETVNSGITYTPALVSGSVGTFAQGYSTTPLQGGLHLADTAYQRSGPNWPESFLAATPGGILHQFILGTPLEHRETSGLGVGNLISVDGEKIFTGSWIPETSGQATLKKFNSQLQLEAEVDAGPITGLGLADINRDGAQEVVVGTHNGDLRIYSNDLSTLLYRRNDGDIVVGARDFVFFPASQNRPALLAYLAGGILRVFRISDLHAPV